MQCRIGDLRYKEVINVNTGLRLGYVGDAVFDTRAGRMIALVVPGAYKVMGLFGKAEDYIIPWDAIRRIGDDIILVEDDHTETREKRPRPKSQFSAKDSAQQKYGEYYGEEREQSKGK